MTNHPDFTVRRADAVRESGAFSFIPHSQRGDDFLFGQFGLITDRDLNMQDVDVICRRAQSRGLVVRDLMREAA